MQVRKSIGPFAAPRRIYIVPDLPKTRSGKIMRRVLRKILEGQVDGMGDVSTVSGLRFCSSLRLLWYWIRFFRRLMYNYSYLTRRLSINLSVLCVKVMRGAVEERISEF